MDIIKKHVDTFAIIGCIITSMIWINGKLNKIETDMAIMKTVLIMKDIYPKELASSMNQHTPSS